MKTETIINEYSAPELNGTQIITDKEGFLHVVRGMAYAGCYYRHGTINGWGSAGNSGCYYRISYLPDQRPSGMPDPNDWWTEGGFELLDSAGDVVCGFPFRWWFDRACYYCYDLKDGAVKVVARNEETGMYAHLEIVPAPKHAISMIKAKKPAWL